jgi:hypothetical protein
MFGVNALRVTGQCRFLRKRLRPQVDAKALRGVKIALATIEDTRCRTASYSARIGEQGA